MFLATNKTWGGRGIVPQGSRGTATWQRPFHVRESTAPNNPPQMEKELLTKSISPGVPSDSGVFLKTWCVQVSVPLIVSLLANIKVWTFPVSWRGQHLVLHYNYFPKCQPAKFSTLVSIFLPGLLHSFPTQLMSFIYISAHLLRLPPKEPGDRDKIYFAGTFKVPVCAEWEADRAEAEASQHQIYTHNCYHNRNFSSGGITVASAYTCSLYTTHCYKHFSLHSHSE